MSVDEVVRLYTRNGQETWDMNMFMMEPDFAAAADVEHRCDVLVGAIENAPLDGRALRVYSPFFANPVFAPPAPGSLFTRESFMLCYFERAEAVTTKTKDAFVVDVPPSVRRLYWSQGVILGPGKFNVKRVARTRNNNNDGGRDYECYSIASTL